MMKKILTIFCLGLAVCLTGCSDDDDVKDTTGTFPFTLTATLPDRQTTADEGGLLQGNWAQGTQLAMLKVNTYEVPKSVMTLTSGDTFTGEASRKIENEDNVAAFYPATAFTYTSSDTLKQELILSGQDGTLEGIARYDFAWGLAKAAVTELSASATIEMENLMHIGKFRFITEDGTQLPAISSMLVTAVADTLYSHGRFDLKSGTFDNLYQGSITLKNPTGISGTTYISFIPSKAKLHFTMVTVDGKIYEAAMEESAVLKKGTVGLTRTLMCTPLPEAKIGDYYYSDGTYSTVKDESKTCIGVVFALNDKDGNIDPSLASSPYGRIVALDDTKRYMRWTINAEDMGNTNYTFVKDALTVACLPYYDGTVGSYSSEDSKEWISGLSIDTESGAIATWPSQGVLTDFAGKSNTKYVSAGTHTYPAGSQCYEYKTAGKGRGEWYLPAAGELALIWTLMRTGIISEESQDGFVNFRNVAYWSSSEFSDGKAWYIHFLNGMVVANMKSSTYYVRAVSAF